MGCQASRAVDPDDTTYAELRAQVDQLNSTVASLIAKSGRPSPQFSIAQYNILAGYLGNNTEPWFLYGVELSAERRQAICKKHVERGPDGKYLNVGWPNYVRGILTDVEIAKVEAVDRDVFAWDMRKERLMECIAALDADVLSLVECDHFDDFFQPRLQALGYDTVWSQRPRPSSHDGCCLAWKRHIFELCSSVVEQYVDRYDPVTKKTYKDRIALMGLLRFRSFPARRVMVVSTHLTRNPEEPKMDALRAKQIGQVLRKLTEVCAEHGITHEVPVVVAGDLNATSFQKLRGIANAVTLMLGQEGESGSIHPFAFDCKELPTGKTSVTSAREVRIDALLFQSARLRLLDSVQAPKLTEPIPNGAHPSDHVPIMASFELRSDLEYNIECARTWFATVSGRVNFVPLTPQQLESAYFVFEVDQNDLVTLSEFTECVVERLGLHALSELEIQSTFHKAADATAGGLTHAGFAASYHAALHARGLPGIDDLRAAFESFDFDQSGALEIGEIETVFDRCSPVAVPEGAQQRIFAAIDRDGDGQVSIEEFLSGLAERWLKAQPAFSK